MLEGGAAELTARLAQARAAAAEDSERGHVLLTVTVERQSQGMGFAGGGETTAARLQLLLIAGPERAPTLRAKGKPPADGAREDKTLKALHRVVDAHASQSKHVPYRDSKVTRLCKDALGSGAAQLIVLGVLEPGPYETLEAWSALYEKIARYIKCDAQRETTDHAVAVRDAAAAVEKAAQAARVGGDPAKLTARSIECDLETEQAVVDLRTLLVERECLEEEAGRMETLRQASAVWRMARR